MPNEEETLKNAPEEGSSVDIDPFKGIKDKYDNDIDKLATAFKEMQSRSTKIENKARPPAEYQIGEGFKDLDKFTVDSSLEIAKEGEYSQKQLDALLNSAKTTITNFQKTTEDKLSSIKKAREEALGSKEDIERLKSFYVGKLPEDLLEVVIESGDPNHINQLKQFRNSKVNSNTPAPTGGNMPDNSMDRQHSIEKNRERLIEIATKLRKAPVEKQGALHQERLRLAKEIVALDKTS